MEDISIKWTEMSQDKNLIVIQTFQDFEAEQVFLQWVIHLLYQDQFQDKY